MSGTEQKLPPGTNLPLAPRRSLARVALTVIGTLAVTVGVTFVAVKVSDLHFHFGGETVTASGRAVVFNHVAVGQFIVNNSPAEPRSEISEQPKPVGSVTGTPAASEPIVTNGGFESGVDSWGTGFWESLFPQSASVIGVRFGGAVAMVAPDTFAHSGRGSLRFEHSSDYMPHRFSSFSQRIKVEPGHRYKTTFWAYLKQSDKGSFALRMIPSRNAPDPV